MRPAEDGRRHQRRRWANDFIYLINWYCSVNLEPQPGNPDSTLRKLLEKATAGNGDQPGAQVCGMFWKSKTQADTLSVTLAVLNPLLFGGQALTPINQESTAFVNALPHSRAVLDGRHMMAGSHHQKVLIVRHGDTLVAWCGGIDINPDRLHEKGVNGSHATGSPLFDVHVRVEGAAAVDLVETFAERWTRHPDRLLVLEEDVAHGPGMLGHTEEVRARVTFAEIIPLPRAVARNAG